jgi:hypothetical protein
MRALGMVVAVLAGGERGNAQNALLDPSLLDAPQADRPIDGTKPEQFLFYAGFDLWHGSVAGYGGMQWAANGLNEDGFVLRLFMSESAEHYRTPAATYRTDIYRGALLPGARIKRGEFELKVFVGLDFENDSLTPDFPGAKLRGPHPGLRITAETWTEPIPELMLATSFYATSIGAGYGARAAAGVRVLDQFWAGPELSGSADELSRQVRIGAHITGLKAADLELSAAAGYLFDSYHRSGIYARIGFLTRQ